MEINATESLKVLSVRYEKFLVAKKHRYIGANSA